MEPLSVVTPHQDGVNWTQLGTSQTISMATNVYVGLAVTSGSISALGTATFDDVWSQLVIRFPATACDYKHVGHYWDNWNFGDNLDLADVGVVQSGGDVNLNTLPMTINSWSNTSISASVPTETTWPLEVVVGPSMNVSNYANRSRLAAVDFGLA